MSENPAQWTPPRYAIVSPRSIWVDPLLSRYPHGAVSVRWRKASCSWVVYLAGHVMESGFASVEACREWLELKHPELAKRADYSRA